MHVNSSILNTKLSALTLALLFVVSMAGSSWAQGVSQRQDHLIKSTEMESQPALNAFEHVAEAGRRAVAFSARKGVGSGRFSLAEGGDGSPANTGGLPGGPVKEDGSIVVYNSGGGGSGGRGSGGSDEGEYDRLVETRPALGIDAMAEQPREAAVVGNYPNPFNPETTIRFEVRAAQQVHLAVYNALGQRVRVLVDGRVEAGAHEARFEAYGLPSGTYFSRLVTEAGVVMRTMVLAR